MYGDRLPMGHGGPAPEIPLHGLDGGAESQFFLPELDVERRLKKNYWLPVSALQDRWATTTCSSRTTAIRSRTTAIRRRRPDPTPARGWPAMVPSIRTIRTTSTWADTAAASEAQVKKNT